MTDAANRLRIWIRDFGHEKQPQFIDDLTAVLDELVRLRAALAESEAIVEACMMLHLHYQGTINLSDEDFHAAWDLRKNLLAARREGSKS